jgi:hypothetical protein
MTRRLVPLVLALALAACATRPEVPDRIPVAPDVALRLPAPAQLGESVEAAQMVTASHGADSFVFEGRLSVSPTGVTLVTTDGLGRRAMTVRWADGVLVTDKAAWLPADLPPAANMLADIMLLYWPAEALRPLLDGASLDEKAGVRQLRHNGETVVDITRGADPWNGDAQLENRAWKYRIQVASRKLSP